MFSVGVIGIGSFGQKHVNALLKLTSHINNLVLFDLDPQTIHPFTSKYPKKISLAASVDEMFARPDIDVIIICTPNNTHESYCRRALEAHKHVLCCKPITASSTKILSLLTLAQHQQKHLAYGQNHQYFPSVSRALKLIRNGDLGNILSMHATIGTNGERIKNTWFWQKKLAIGGAMIDNGHHLLDLAVEICGPFNDCVGHHSTRKWLESEVEDYGLAIFTAQKANASGCEAVLRASWRQPQGYFAMQVWGDQGWVSVQVNDQEKITVSISDTITYDLTSSPRNSLELADEAFIERCVAVDDGTTFPEHDAHVQHVTNMIQAFYRSARLHRMVKVNP